MQVIDELGRDHARILEFLAALGDLADEVGSGRAEARRVELAIEFVDRYIERFHHVREEHVLFLRLVETGRTSRAIGDHLVHCHDECRDQLEGMRLNAAVDTEDRRTAWVWNARAFIELTREHIRNEEERLYPAIRETLDDADQAWLADRMATLFPDAMATTGWARDCIARIGNEPRVHETTC